MTLPASGPISLANIQTEYGGSNPIGINEYYKNGGIVENDSGSPNVPFGGQISFSNYYGARKYIKTYQTLGDTTTNLMYGSDWPGGSTGSRPPYANGLLRALSYQPNQLIYSGKLPFYGATDISIHNSPNTETTQTAYFSDASSKIFQVSSGGLGSVWFPFVPTLYGYCNYGYTVGAPGPGYYRHSYSLGTARLEPVSDRNLVFCWRSPDSLWTNTRIQGMFGFNSSQLSYVKNSFQVWWEYFYVVLNSVVQTGFSIINANTFINSGAQAAWNNRTNFYYTYHHDYGGEWGNVGFDFTPTVNGSTVTNVGPSSIVWNSNLGRSDNRIFGINGETDGSNLRSDYTVTIGHNDLVIPMLYNNDGMSTNIFSGWPLKARFGYIEVT